MPAYSTLTYLLDPIELASRDEITALQTDLLKATLANVYNNVPHYRMAFDAAGVHPGDFKSLPDLAKFPFTTKKDLRANYPFGMFAVPQSQVMRRQAPRVSRRWWATPPTTSAIGLTW